MLTTVIVIEIKAKKLRKTKSFEDRKGTPLLELCARNRNPAGKMNDPKDRVISILGGRSFAFIFADALELHWT